MNRAHALVTILSGCIVVFLLGCGGGSTLPPPITVTFPGPSSQTIGQGQSITITVVLANDTSGKGVSWKLTGPGALSKQTSISVEYDAPASLASDTTATITATSLADPTKMNTYTVNLAAIAVSVSPSSVNVIAKGSQPFTATVNNDASNAGVTWTISPASGAGTLSNATSTSVTYNAPATAPASDAAVTITATSVADTTKAGTAAITVPAITVSITAAGDTTLQAGAALALTASVGNDPSNSGVAWSISPVTGSGTLSNATSTSVTYNAPPPPPPANDLTVTITATSLADPTKSSTASITVAAIAISVSPNPATVPAGTTQDFSATVSYDPNNKGVTWSISPSSGAGTLSNATSTTVTFAAPANAPASNVTVTLTATSISDTSRTASATITVPAISVGPVTPSSALIPINAMQQFTATVNYDPANAGVNWDTVQTGGSCGSACGSFTPTSTASGAATTYTAPAAVPANPAVTISATSVTDATKSGTASITLTNGTVKLVPAALNFGNVKHNRTKSMTLALTNTGTTALTISGMTTTTHYSETNDCGSSVAAGASCTITVKFTPGGSGSFSGTLTINDSSTDSPQVVPLSGKGTAIAAAVIPTAISAQWSVTAPAPTGPSRVGTRIVHLVDSAREDPFAGSGSKRELMVRFWYPAAVDGECIPAEYTSPAVWGYFSQLVRLPLPEVKTNSCQDTAIAAGPHPVVMFTHGYTGTFTDYTYLFEDLASRGYIVAAPNHTNEATAVEFPDGRIVKSMFGSHLGGHLRTDEDSYTSAVFARLSDFKFVLRELDRLNVAPKSPFAGRLDMSRVAIAGHSLGGLAALAGAEREPRFKARIILDGSSLDRASGTSHTPLLLLVTGRKQWGVDECSLWSNSRGPRLAVMLPDADHLAPSDAVWLARGVVKTGHLSAEKMADILRSYIAAFLDANLRGEPLESMLNGQSPDYPDVVVTTANESLCSKQ